MPVVFPLRPGTDSPCGTESEALFFVPRAPVPSCALLLQSVALEGPGVSVEPIGHRSPLSIHPTRLLLEQLCKLTVSTAGMAAVTGNMQTKLAAVVIVAATAAAAAASIQNKLVIMQTIYVHAHTCAHTCDRINLSLIGGPRGDCQQISTQGKLIQVRLGRTV